MREEPDTEDTPTQSVTQFNKLLYVICIWLFFALIITRNVRSFALKKKLFVNSITHKLPSLFFSVSFKDCECLE